MARSFSAAALDNLEVASVPVTGSPFSMSAWFNPTLSTTTQAIMALRDTGTANNYYEMRVQASSGIRLHSEGGASSNNLTTSTTVSANAWQHACAVVAADNDRRVYLNGGGKATSSVSISPTGLDTTQFARSTSAGPNYFDGLLCEWAVWDIALSDDYVLSLADGVCPLLVRPDHLVSYWPGFGRWSPESDIVGGLNATVTGTTAAAHTRIFRPHRRPASRFGTTIASLVLGQIDGLSTATLTLSTPANLVLGSIAGLSTAALTLTAPSLIFLSSIAGLSTATLSLTAPSLIFMGTISGVATITMSLGSPALLTLSSAGIATVTLDLTAPGPQQMPVYTQYNLPLYELSMELEQYSETDLIPQYLHTVLLPDYTQEINIPEYHAMRSLSYGRTN